MHALARALDIRRALALKVQTQAAGGIVLAVCFCILMRQIPIWRSFFSDFSEHSFYFLYNFALEGAIGVRGVDILLALCYNGAGGCRDVHPWGCRILHPWGAEFFTPYYIQTFYVSDLLSDKTEEGTHDERGYHYDAGAMVQSTV